MPSIRIKSPASTLDMPLAAHRFAADIAPDSAAIAQVLATVERLIARALEREREYQSAIDAVAPAWRASARNLTHFISLRQHDLLELQTDLIALGLSSLAREHAHVMATLAAVRTALRALLGKAPHASAAEGVNGLTLLSVAEAQRRAHEHACRALGPAPEDRTTRLMVTLSEDTPQQDHGVAELITGGMQLARIDCAHGTSAEWLAIAAQVRTQAHLLGKPCRVSFDLAGPQLCTGPIRPGLAVRKFKPRYDEAGRMLQAAAVRLVCGDAATIEWPDALPVPEKLIAKARPGDRIVFRDLRGRHRVLKVLSMAGGVCLCSCDRRCYVAAGIRLTLQRSDRQIATGRVAAFAAGEGVIRLSDGDELEVFLGNANGIPASIQPQTGAHDIARIGCDLSEVFAAARPGARVLLDAGWISARVHSCSPLQMHVRVESPGLRDARLRADKAINLPDTPLSLPALTPADRAALRAVAGAADAVALSFVQSGADVRALLAELTSLGADHLCVILKIKTRAAFEALPELLYAAMAHPAIAVMVGRADLASEAGFERLSELQEQIQGICEAAHVPVIWATEALQTFTRDVRPTRTEVTDAAMGGRAACVMLHNGPYVAHTTRFLDEVLTLAHMHQSQEATMLGHLSAPESAGAQAARH